MADPRFYDNRGPFALAQICAAVGTVPPAGADPEEVVLDLATLSGAGPSHLTFYSGILVLAGAFAQSQAGFCFTAGRGKPRPAPPAMVTIPVGSVLHAFATTASLFYPESSLPIWPDAAAIHPTAEIGDRVALAPGVTVGPGAAIGEGTRLGPGAAIGRGVAIGRDCEIGSNASISHAYVGDGVAIFPGAQIGQPGFGFASGAAGHVKIPQLGRVIIQDRVEIGACTAIDRGALADTIIGEGTKIDNLVQIGHNVHIGRHCVIAGQTGVAGSCMIGDFVVIGGRAAIADHTRIGDHARLAGCTVTTPHTILAGNADYGGLPAKPVRDWVREMRTLAILAKTRKRDTHD